MAKVHQSVINLQWFFCSTLSHTCMDLYHTRQNPCFLKCLTTKRTCIIWTTITRFRRCARRMVKNSNRPCSSELFCNISQSTVGSARSFFILPLTDDNDRVHSMFCNMRFKNQPNMCPRDICFAHDSGILGARGPTRPKRGRLLPYNFKKSFS